MKSAPITAALLASVAVAQPHGHHHGHAKRDLVTEWEMVYETVTVMVDGTSTETILPPKETTEATAAAFYETSSSAPAPEPTPEPTVESPATYETAQEPATPSTSSTSTSSSSTSTSSTSISTPEPEPTTYQEPTTTPTTTAVASTTSSTSEATYATAAPSSGGGGDDSGIPYGVDQVGEVTHYVVGLGSCGYEDTGKGDSMNIAAIPHALWDGISMLTNYGVDQPAHPLCDKTITVSYGGNTVDVIARDRCEGCAISDLDISDKAFKELFTDLGEGRMHDITWIINP